MGAWDEHHGTLDAPIRYGADDTYVRAAQWVQHCRTVEDWGAGGGGLHRFLHTGVHYVGVDSSATPYAGVMADLVSYRSTADGVVLRHVLEHNHDWRAVLDNAVASFTQRLVVVLFTPRVGATHLLATEVGYGDVPVYAFAREDIEAALDAVTMDWWWDEHWYPEAHYGTETMLLVRRKAAFR